MHVRGAWGYAWKGGMGGMGVCKDKWKRGL